MAATSDNLSIWGIPFSCIAQIVTWLLVVGGWLIVNWQNNTRERRKEVRTALDKLSARLDQLEKDAIKYHTSSQPQYDEANHIKIELQRIKKQINHLHILALEFEEDGMVKLRQSITLKNFDTHTFSPQPPYSPILSGISSAKDVVIDRLESAFSTKFRIS